MVDNVRRLWVGRWMAEEARWNGKAGLTFSSVSGSISSTSNCEWSSPYGQNGENWQNEVQIHLKKWICQILRISKTLEDFGHFSEDKQTVIKNHQEKVSHGKNWFAENRYGRFSCGARVIITNISYRYKSSKWKGFNSNSFLVPDSKLPFNKENERH